MASQPAQSAAKAFAADVEERAAKRSAAPAKPFVPGDSAEDLAQACAFLALDKKAEDVAILRVTDLTSYADFFVVASAPSERQVQAIARNVDDELRRVGKKPVGTEGLEQGHWVLVDFGSVVFHIFLSSARNYYDLEGFWSDAPRLEIDEVRGRGMIDASRAAHAAGM